jgi:hypothetical protein
MKSIRSVLFILLMFCVYVECLISGFEEKVLIELDNGENNSHRAGDIFICLHLS